MSSRLRLRAASSWASCATTSHCRASAASCRFAGLAVAAKVVFAVLALVWHPVFWVPLIVISLVATYTFIVVRGSTKELTDLE
jgi:hypothetical protein